MINEQQEQELDPESERQTLPPLPPDACPQQALRSAIALAQDAVGKLLVDEASRTDHLSALGRALLRIGEAADRIITPQPKGSSDE